MENRIQQPHAGLSYWEGQFTVDIPTEQILQQADPNALLRLEKMDKRDRWTKHLFSLEKYEREVRGSGWKNPIIVYQGKTPEDWLECPSGPAREEHHKYIIAVGYNRHYWSLMWDIKYMRCIVCSNSVEAHSFRSLSEADGKVKQFGIQRVFGNLTLPREEIKESGLLEHGRFPQWQFPRFEIDPKRIVERIKGKDWKELSGAYRVVRPMPGTRSYQSKFYQVAGEPPIIGERFESAIMPEGWILMEEDFPKYWEIFRNLK